MTIDEIIMKWLGERDRLQEKIQFCQEHNMPHEKEFIIERDKAIADVLYDLRFGLNREEEK